MTELLSSGLNSTTRHPRPSTEFTEDRLGPLVDGLKAGLEKEVQCAAPLSRQRPNEAVRRSDQHLASYREFITRRRAFLLKRPAVSGAGPFRRSEVRQRVF